MHHAKTLVEDFREKSIEQLHGDPEVAAMIEKKQAKAAADSHLTQQHRRHLDAIETARGNAKTVCDFLDLATQANLATSILENCRTSGHGAQALGSFANHFVGIDLLRRLAPEIRQLVAADLAKVQEEFDLFCKTNRAALKELKLI